MQEKNLNINFVVESYQNKVRELTNENVLMNAYQKQLEDEMNKLRAQVAELHVRLSEQEQVQQDQQNQ